MPGCFGSIPWNSRKVERQKSATNDSSRTEDFGRSLFLLFLHESQADLLSGHLRFWIQPLHESNANSTRRTKYFRVYCRDCSRTLTSYGFSVLHASQETRTIQQVVLFSRLEWRHTHKTYFLGTCLTYCHGSAELSKCVYMKNQQARQSWNQYWGVVGPLSLHQTLQECS